MPSGLQLPQGLAIALLCGLMSGCFNVGLEFGAGINFGELTDPMYRTLPATFTRYSGRFCHQRRILLLSEQQEQYLERLQQWQRMGQQPLLLPARRCIMVQPVLRSGARQGLPHRVAHSDDTVVLHTDGPQRDILQPVGHHPQGMERMLITHHHSSIIGIVVLIISCFLPQLI